MAKTDERTTVAVKRIVSMIETYGKTRFALGLVRYYGLRSLLDRKELDDIQEIINGIDG